MLESWANETMQERMAVACYKEYSKYHCNTCDSCSLNIKFLHHPNTDKREIAYTMVDIVGAEKRATKNLWSLRLFLIAVVALGFWFIKIHYPQSQRSFSSARRITTYKDYNGDGLINCIDHSISMYKAAPSKVKFFYIPQEQMKDGTAHLTVLFNNELVEAQAPESNPSFEDFWGFLPAYGYVFPYEWMDDWSKVVKYGTLTLVQPR